MRRKKLAAQLMAVLLMMTLVLTGCGDKGEPEAKPDTNQAVQSAIDGGTQWLIDQLQLAEYNNDSDDAVFLLERADKLSEENAQAYLQSLQAAVEYGSDFDQVTQWQKIAFAAAACGGDPTDQAGLDFLSMALNYDVNDEEHYVDLYVLNSKLLVSGAFDVHNTDHQQVIEALLAAQNEDGAFEDQWGTTIDSTSLTLQALAASGAADQEPVKGAIERAVAYLSSQQGADGSMTYNGEPSLASTAQACIALSVLGIDPAVDEAFVKEGNSLLAALIGQYQAELEQTEQDYYNMTQGLMGLVAYQRLQAGEHGYYSAGMLAQANDNVQPAQQQGSEANDQETALGQSPVVSGEEAQPPAPNQAPTEQATESQSDTITLAITSDEGVILAATAVDLEADDTAYSVLKRVSREQGIAMEVSGSGSKVYVQGINDLYEFDKGATSGWMYQINGEFPTKSAGSYKLTAGDTVNWIYTLDMGKDVAGEVQQ